MNQNIQNITNEENEIIDFDDEFCENDNGEEQLTPDESSNQNYEIHKEDQIQVSPEEEEQEQNDKDLDEENIIYDPKVKELNEIDIHNKQAIIDILMGDDLIIKKPVINEEAIKEKNKMKYSYVKSNINIQNNSSPDSQDKKSSFGKVSYQFESKEGSPELIKDINAAAFLLKDQIIEENEDVAKILFDDISKTKKEKKTITGKEISKKVKEILERKKKNLAIIEEKMREGKKDEEKFIPKINKRKKDGARRDLNTFLESQNKFLKDIENKIQSKQKIQEDDIKKKNFIKPKIDKNSEKIVEKLSNTGPAYMRLYNKRTENNEKIKEVEEKLKSKQKEAEQKRKQEENEIKKNNPYKHIKSKISMYQNTTNPTGIQTNNNASSKRLNRGKSAINVTRQNNIINNENIPKKKFDYKDIQTNKMVFNKFISNFDEVLISLGVNDENKNNENNLEELDEYQYHNLLYQLGVVAYPPELKNKNDNNPEGKNEEEKNNAPEGMLKQNEKKLINDSFNLLKLDGDKVKIIDVKNFLICLLDMQNYNLYQMYKSIHEQELKDKFPPLNCKKEDIPELIVTKQNEELASNIDKKNKLNNKYFSVSTDNKIIFTLEKIPNMKKDYKIFSLNYRNQKKKGKSDKVINIMKNQCPFKPEINENSHKLYEKYKEKVFSLQNETVTSNSNSQLKKSNLEYIDRILLLDKKRIAETQKIKEEMEKKQIKECTFKPRINNYQINKKGKKQKEENKTSNEIIEGKKSNENSGKKIINQNKKNKDKFDELYENGKYKLKNRSIKTREEIELEEQQSECTFQPNIKSLEPKQIPKTNFNNDIYNEKEYKILYERLKHGRLERMVKESSNDRYGLNNELKQFVKDNKEFNFIQNQQYFDPEDPFYYNNPELNNMMNSLNNQLEQENIEKSNIIKDDTGKNKIQENNIKETTKFQNKDNNIAHIDKNIMNKIENINNNLIIEKSNNTAEENYSEELEKEKNDDIPLLIIDVNIRQGVKKKIYVYEGDTPEALSEKFAKEQNLDVETKNKLQSLIQTHMQKLLTRIEEENQSNSEKSQNIHGQKNK